MLKRAFAMLTVGVALFSCVTVATSESPPPRATPVRENARAGANANAPPQTASVCPDDLSVEMTGTISLEKDPSREGNAYESMRWVPEHKKPIIGDGSFAIDRAAAIDKVIAIEEKHPLLVPAGYRAAIAEHGRDASFRLAMARCELDQKDLQRRVAEDLALALLLGADEAEVRAITPDISMPPPCRHFTPQTENACDQLRGSWASSRVRKISHTELKIEDALSRGLASLAQPKDEAHSSIGALLFRFGHICGGSGVCVAQAFNIGGKPRFVHWDRRDGGAHHAFQASTATLASNKRCKDATGWEGQESCLQACWSGGLSGAAGATCRSRCLNYCEPH